MLITVVGMIIKSKDIVAIEHSGGLPMHQLASPQERKRVTEVQGSMTEVISTTRARRVWRHSLVLMRRLEEEPVDHVADFGWQAEEWKGSHDDDRW